VGDLSSSLLLWKTMQEQGGGRRLSNLYVGARLWQGAALAQL
jgi:hypothetical protein